MAGSTCGLVDHSPYAAADLMDDNRMDSGPPFSLRRAARFRELYPCGKIRTWTTRLTSADGLPPVSAYKGGGKPRMTTEVSRLVRVAN